MQEERHVPTEAGHSVQDSKYGPEVHPLVLTLAKSSAVPSGMALVSKSLIVPENSGPPRLTQWAPSGIMRLAECTQAISEQILIPSPT